LIIIRYALSLFHEKLPNGTLSLDRTVEMELGAVYVISVVYVGDVDFEYGFDDPENYQIGFHEITKPNSVHILLLLVQYIVMSIGEIMFSITIMDFSYAEVCEF
jgi:dipeptide/tripeptide permease